MRTIDEYLAVYTDDADIMIQVAAKDLRAWRDAFNCDCIYSPVSSRCCTKCGRQATISYELFKEIYEQRKE